MDNLIIRQNIDLAPDGLHDWKKAASSWLDNFGSEQTRRAYRQAWSGFLTFSEITPDQVTQDDVIAYRRHMETTVSPKTGKPYTQETINLHLSALSSFFAWAKDRGLRPDNPTDKVKRKAVTPYGKAKWLDGEAGEDLEFLSQIPTDTEQGLRDRAIMLLFLTLALRVAEVVSLNIGSLRRQGRKVFMTYTRKRGETREVELPPETAEAIDEYLTIRPNTTGASPLFTATEAGRGAARRLGFEAGKEGRLTTRAIHALVRSYANKAFGKGSGIHPHSLRHTAAMIASKTHSIAEVSELLGHASLQVTTIYLHTTGKATAKVAADLGRRYGKA